jgi:hypothetical protein
VTAREGSARAGLQVLLELRRLLAGREGNVGPQFPRREFGGVRDSSCVVLAKPRLEIAGQTDVRLFGVGLTLE